MASIDSTHPKRTQFSSCDLCRRARSACDALQAGYKPGQTQWAGSCSRCSMRGQRCTFKWIKNAKKERRGTPGRAKTGHITSDSFINWAPLGVSTPVSNHGGYPSGLASNVGSEPRSTHESSLSPSPIEDCEDVETKLREWSAHLFDQGFGTAFGRWLGKNGCPVANDPASQVIIPPTEIFSRLDKFIREESEMIDPIPFTHERLAKKPNRESQITESMGLAICAHGAHRLATVPNAILGTDADRVEDFARNIWRAARRDMLKVINRLCYRSVWTLYLFGNTPIPVGITGDEEEDGITGTVCHQTALKQVQQLRSRLHPCQSDQPGICRWSDERSTAFPPPPRHALTAAFIDLESRAYWAAVTWDTSSALALNVRSTLVTGLRGGCSEPAWILTQSFLTAFRTESATWGRQGFVMSDSIATQTISAAGISRLYVSRTVASLKEGLMEGENEEAIMFVWKTVLDAMDIFDSTIRRPLANCKRQLHFLPERTRFGYYESIMRYYLGILLLCNILEAASRHDLLDHLTEAMVDAEHESFNALQLGLESTYRMSVPGSGASEPDARWQGDSTSFSSTFIAADPYPQLVVVSVTLLGKSIKRRFLQGKLEYDAYDHLSSTLLGALNQLPKTSKSVQFAVGTLEQTLRETGNRR